MGQLDIRQDQLLRNYTTIGIGGPARYFVETASIDELREALSFSRQSSLPVLILGGGSNMLVCDEGWPGLVIRITISDTTISPESGGRQQVVCGAGVQWDDLVKLSVEQNLQGIECLSGIPGTVGASPIQNIGAYGQEVKETIAWVEGMDRHTGELVQFDSADCEFAYRWSRFKGRDKDRYVITRVAFNLTPGGAPSVRYGDLTRYFDQHQITTPTLRDVRNAVIEVRGSKGMVVDPAVPDSRSCGSFFMNPIVSDGEAARIKEILEREAGPGAEVRMPEFPAGLNQVKLSAAWLMEKSGLQKGTALGGVGISSRHVLALINRGEGTAAEILQLVDQVKNQVFQKFGIMLHPEPMFIGFDQAGDHETAAQGAHS